MMAYPKITSAYPKIDAALAELAAAEEAKIVALREKHQVAVDRQFAEAQASQIDAPLVPVPVVDGRSKTEEEYQALLKAYNEKCQEQQREYEAQLDAHIAECQRLKVEHQEAVATYARLKRNRQWDIDSATKRLKNEPTNLAIVAELQRVSQPLIEPVLRLPLLPRRPKPIPAPKPPLPPKVKLMPSLEAQRLQDQRKARAKATKEALQASKAALARYRKARGELLFLLMQEFPIKSLVMFNQYGGYFPGTVAGYNNKICYALDIINGVGKKVVITYDEVKRV